MTAGADVLDIGALEQRLAAGLDFIENPPSMKGIAKLFPAHVGGARYLSSLPAVEPEARIARVREVLSTRQ